MKKHIISFLSFLILVFIDQITKLIAQRNLLAGPVSVIDGVFEFHYHENRGMAFGLLQNQLWIFIVITVIMLAAIAFCYFRIPSGKRYYPLIGICVFICAGAVGNFIDRIFRGYVIDFCYIKLIDFPIFNLADIFVTWPAVLLIILLAFKYKDSEFKKSHD